ncbi:hypothetical protein [Lentibacter sp.]|uniref:hypothetical protein n=1 Tax=Lentibacter sp. TaxID=2024994 RepID=UPI003F6A1708
MALLHQSNGRSRAALITLTGVYTVLLALVWWIDLNLYIAVFLALFTLPALWEAVQNPVSTFELSDSHMRWSTPRLADEMPVGLILRARFDTRLDLSVKVTLFLKDNRKLRLPHACTPPHEALEAELRALGVKTERHHFSLIG